VADRLEVSPSSLLCWIERGVVRARRENGGWRRWIVWADAAALEPYERIGAATTLPPNSAIAGQPAPCHGNDRQ
jgi:hypothetical protein